MIYIGIDPGDKKSHGYSVWINGKLDDFGKIESVDQFIAILKDYGISNKSTNLNSIEVLIEDQYLQNNYKTSKSLTFQSGKLAGICDMYKIKYTTVNVATWTSRWGGYKSIEKGLSVHFRKKEKIRRLIDYISMEFQTEVIDEDETSAILIPYFMRIKK